MNLFFSYTTGWPRFSCEKIWDLKFSHYRKTKLWPYFLPQVYLKSFYKQALIKISCKNIINRKRRYKLTKFSQLILDHLVKHTIHIPLNYHKLLLQAIQENPQQFINLLGEGGGGGAEPPTGGAAPPPPAATVHITPEEKAAIDRVRICRLVYFVTWINLVFGSFKWHSFKFYFVFMWNAWNVHFSFVTRNYKYGTGGSNC